jgi:hypothetical protein
MTLPRAGLTLISCISRSPVSQRKKGIVGRGITRGGGLGNATEVGLLTAVGVGGADVWTASVGLTTALVGGCPPVEQAASNATENAPERRLGSLMISKRCRSRRRYAIR